MLSIVVGVVMAGMLSWMELARSNRRLQAYLSLPPCSFLVPVWLDWLPLAADGQRSNLLHPEFVAPHGLTASRSGLFFIFPLQSRRHGPDHPFSLTKALDLMYVFAVFTVGSFS
jgi:hypothetical protein